MVRAPPIISCSEASIDPVIPLPQHAPLVHPLKDQEEEPRPVSKVQEDKVMETAKEMPQRNENPVMKGPINRS